MRLLVLSCLWTVASPALAAEVTEMPPALRGDVKLAYHGAFQFDGLAQDDVSVGRRNITRHDIVLGAEFAPTDGVAVHVDVPITPSMTISYSDVHKMAFDPVTSSGTYLDAPALDDPPRIQGSGSDGIWLGVAGAPFSETFSRGQQVTWRLDVSFRTPTSKNLWTGAEGDRGAGNGGSAWRLGAAFSSDRGTANPYLALNAVAEGRVQTDLVDYAGTTWAQAVTVKPGNTVDLLGGVEIVASKDEKKGSRYAVDLHLGFGYRAWAKIPSGLFLPSVLDESKSIVVDQGDHDVGRGGIGLVADVNKYFGFDVGVEGRYAFPYTIENVYPVKTSWDSFGIAANVELQGHFR